MQKAKDGIIRLIAIEKCRLSEAATRGATHLIKPDGRPLCGTRKKMVESLSPLPVCGRCKARMNKLVDEMEKEVLRNYWDYDIQHYGMTAWAHAWAIRWGDKPDSIESDVQQLGLPTELLPTGTGGYVSGKDKFGNDRGGKEAVGEGEEADHSEAMETNQAAPQVHI